MGERLRHLRLVGTERAYAYTAPAGGGGAFDRPPRDRVPHAQRLRQQLMATEAAAQQRGLEPSDPHLLTYVLRTQDLELVASLERERSGIELLNVTTSPDGVRATVRVPRDKRHVLEGILERYETSDGHSGRPKHQNLVECIETIGLADERDLWTDSAAFPSPHQVVWWEVWLATGGASAPATAEAFRVAATAAGFEVKPRWVQFPDRVVVVARGAAQLWSAAPRLLLRVAELRLAKPLASTYTARAPREQSRLVAELLGRLEPPPDDAPAVCLLDSGVDREHALLAPGLSARDTHTLDPAWGAHDDHPQKHGTGMAGIALYGRLEHALDAQATVVLAHRLESVKLLSQLGPHDPDVYGHVTQEAVARAATAAPHRERAVCLAVTADSRDGGLPSAWSSAIDQLCAGGEVTGEPTLMLVAAGNLRSQIRGTEFRYPMIAGAECGVEDPGQAWNALTVGAMTDLVMLADPDFKDYQPIAPPGDVSPTSRTSLAWPEDARDDWPFKPDLVMEGGNWAATAGDDRDSPDDLALLTTIVRPSGALFTTTSDTSPATAAAAGLAAQIMAQYPGLRPETVRGLLVHSARWTPAMMRRFGADRGAVAQRLRCYGYGVPDRERALHSAENAATMVFEGALQPYRLEDSQIKTHEMHVHELPWPTEVLESLGAQPVRLRVTLSYFVEPSPGRRGWTRRHRYASHGLRFDLRRPDESRERFLSRLSDSALDEEVSDSAGTRHRWAVGVRGRTRGSLHSDWLELSGASLAACGQIAVFPVTGWWRERKSQERWDRLAHYSLIVSLETDDAEVELYSAIKAEQVVTVGT